MSKTYFSLLLMLPLASVAGADTVTLSGSDDGSGTILVDGQIVDYTGSQIIIDRGIGTERTYPASRVKKVETKWPEGWAEGLAALEAAQYATAAQRFTAAARADRRAWVRRLAMQYLMRCYARTGDQASAGQLLVQLVRSDPTTPALEEAPLAWHAGSPLQAKLSDEWLAAGELPAAQLLGASHALATSRRTQATSVLKALIRSSDKRVAALAEMQSWRVDIVTAKADELTRREARLRQAPEALQAGGWLVLGDTHRQQKQYDAAALAYLRANMLADNQPTLAAHALWRASEALRTAGQLDEANKLAGQLIDEYPQTDAAREARDVLESGTSE